MTENERREREAFEGLSAKLWCDLRTDEERSAWLLLGRGHETGVVAQALQNDLAMAYHRLALLSASTPSAEARKLDHGLNKGVAMWLKNFLRPGEKVIWREPFRWKDEDGVLANHYEMFDLPQLAKDFGYEIVEDFHHAAIIRAAMAPSADNKENGK